MISFCKLYVAGIVSFVLAHHCCAEQVPDVQNLTLRQAFQIAVERNHDLRLSVNAVQSAGAAIEVAGASPNPTLTLQTASINPKVGIGDGTLRNKTVDSSIRIDQLIERGGKRELRKAVAATMEDAARSDLIDTRRQLHVLVSQAYYDALASEEKLVILRHTADLYDTTISAAQKRQKAGDIANADVARLQVDALRAKNDVLQGEADVKKAKHSLATLLGSVNLASQIRLSDTWPTAQFDSVEPSDSLIEQRADVVAAKLRLESAKTARKLALAARTRDVSVGAQYDHYPVSEANTQGTGNSFGFSVQIPLFFRYQFDGEIRAAEVAVDAASETLEKIRDAATNELHQNWQDARSSFDQLRIYDDKLLVAAKKTADAAEFAFQHGAISIMDVLDTRRTYRATQLDALTARASYAKSLAAWQATLTENLSQ
ncbi:TolC family protein [Undibacterium sp.]|jgi:cobalt-zinc-cadmium efflux system outer membrane protein|uniref:TolC family protein n=1 Tax=Undibacterium sp. TaxID=1914977 RepID=UPI002B77CA47|nr:TolC family protein [Undibacterium sp.]HTD02230.1 TolC family protein [Undibacterium sp.]